MALAIDGSSPAAVTVSGVSTTPISTASFSPPAGSHLVVAFSANTASGVTPSTPTITDNLGTPLAYGPPLQWKTRATAPTANGQVAIWTAPVVAGGPMIVSVTTGTASGNQQAALKVWVFTGQDPSTPVGTSGKNASTSASSISQSYTGSGTGGWGLLVTCDWSALGSFTAGTGCTVDATGTVPTTQFSYAFARRTTADDTNGGANTLNVNAAGSSTDLSWAWVEMLPPAAATTASPGPALVLVPPRSPSPGFRFATKTPAAPESKPTALVVAVPRVPTGAVVLVSQMRDVTPIVAGDSPARALVSAVPPPRPPATVITTRMAADPPAGTASPPVALVNAAPPSRRPAVVITTQVAADLAVVVAAPPQTFVIAAPARRSSTAPIVLHPWVEEAGPAATVVVAQPAARGRGFLAVTSTRTDADAWPTTVVVASPTRSRVGVPIVTSSRADPPVVVAGAVMPVAYVIAAPRLRGPGSLLTAQAVSADCHLPRPDTGDTARPGTGTTARPTGTTGRPDSGLILRPDTGDTPNPC